MDTMPELYAIFDAAAPAALPRHRNAAQLAEGVGLAVPLTEKQVARIALNYPGKGYDAGKAMCWVDEARRQPMHVTSAYWTVPVHPKEVPA